MKRIGRLHVLTDTTLQDRFSHLELARLAVQGGADLIQFRQKSGSTRSLIETARDMKAICEAAEAVFVVNDRIDVAMASDADGVHIGQDDFPIAMARDLLGADRIVGGSASNLEEALACVRDGADYVGFGPVFPTTSKADAGPASGLETLRSIADAVDVPVIAIGGIDEGNAARVMDAGAHGIAVISAVCCRPDPGGAATGLCRLIQRS